jgi:hypothetical protein
VHIVVNCETRFCSLFLGPGGVWCDLYGPGSDRIGQSGGSGRVLQYTRTMPLLNSPWSSPKKISFRKFWRLYLDQNLLRITNPVSDLTGYQ